MIEPGRIVTAMITPMLPDGGIDYAGAGALALALLGSGSDSLVVTGTTGEAPTLSMPEKMRLWREVVEAVAGRGAVIAGAGDNCTADSVEFSRQAAETGVDALLLTVPYYNKPTQEGMYRHFAAIAEAVDLPCIPYNIPGRTGVNMTADTQLRLSRIANVIGVKEASGDMAQVARIIEEAGPDFHVWSGNDEDTFAIVSLGGYGVISVLSHLVGRQIAAMVELLRSGRTAEAAAVHRRLLPLVDALFCVTSPIPVKYALGVLGAPAGPLRLPMCGPDDASGARIMAEVRRHAIDLPLPAAAR